MTAANACAEIIEWNVVVSLNDLMIVWWMLLVIVLNWNRNLTHETWHVLSGLWQCINLLWMIIWIDHLWDELHFVRILIEVQVLQRRLEDWWHENRPEVLTQVDHRRLSEVRECPNISNILISFGVS